MKAVTKRDIRLVDLLLRFGVDPNMQDSHGRGPLELASIAAIAQLLLDRVPTLLTYQLTHSSSRKLELGG